MNDTLEQRFWKYASPGSFLDCWLWQGPTDNDQGYGRIYISRHKYIYAHRLSYELHFGSIPDGLDILHSCDNPLCVNPHHLSAGTHLENMEDMKNRKRYVVHVMKGEQHYRTKLTDADVLEIRSLHSQGVSNTVIAKRFGVLGEAVRKIVSRERWKHLP